MTMKKIVFMGTPSYATRILEALSQVHDVVLLVTQEDKPVGRKQILTPPDTKAWALSHRPSLEVFQPKTLRDETAWAKIAALSPDAIVVAAYGQILPKAVLEIAPCINLHASLLPQYRGASPIQSTLLSNESYAGVTSMLMEEGLDTGAMLGFSYVRILDEDTSETLFEKLADQAAALTLTTLEHFNRLAPWKQVGADATHCKKIKRENGLISWAESASKLVSRYKAFTPWPGIYLESGLKIIEMKRLETSSSHEVCGQILDVTKEGIILTCKEGTVLVSKVQPPSKSVMSAIDYIRGKRLSSGDLLV
jgi:methionyl-tRNA formyltransferase